MNERKKNDLLSRWFCYYVGCLPDSCVVHIVRVQYCTNDFVNASHSLAQPTASSCFLLFLLLGMIRLVCTRSATSSACDRYLKKSSKIAQRNSRLCSNRRQARVTRQVDFNQFNPTVQTRSDIPLRANADLDAELN